MFTMQVAVSVDIPQLDALRTTLEQIGAQLMADFSLLTQTIADLTTTLDQELAEIQLILQADTLDQVQLDQAVAALADLRTRLAGAVTPPPTP